MAGTTKNVKFDIGVDYSGAQTAVKEFMRIVGMMEETLTNTRRRAAMEQVSTIQRNGVEEVSTHRKVTASFSAAQAKMREEIKKTKTEQENYLKVTRDEKGNIAKIDIMQRDKTPAPPNLIQRAVAKEREVSPGIQEYGGSSSTLGRLQKIAFYADNVVRSTKAINEEMSRPNTKFADTFASLNQSMSPMVYMLGPNGALIVGTAAVAMASGKWLRDVTGLNDEYKKITVEIKKQEAVNKIVEDELENRKEALFRYNSANEEWVKKQLAQQKQIADNASKHYDSFTPGGKGQDAALENLKKERREYEKLKTLLLNFELDKRRQEDADAKASEERIAAAEKEERQAWESARNERERQAEMSGIVISNITKEQQAEEDKQAVADRLSAKTSMKILDPSLVSREKMKPDEFYKYQDDLKSSADAMAWKKVLSDSGILQKETSWKIAGDSGGNGLSQTTMRSLVVADKQTEVLKSIDSTMKVTLEVQQKALSTAIQGAANTGGADAVLKLIGTWQGDT